MLPLFAERVGLLVVDEAHCISRLGPRLPPRLPAHRRRCWSGCPTASPCSGTTATANDRVVADVEEQLAAGAARRRCGPTAGRSGARACAWRSSSCPARPTGWPGSRRGCRSCEGSGIVYTLTKRDADLVAELARRPRDRRRGLQRRGRRRRSASRSRSGCSRNDLKAVVATSALGMGYDKPDLGFVVHYQAPGSVIAYYQQVGRAGRGVEHADVVLLRGAEDRRIQDFFIEQAFPRRELVDRGARRARRRGRGRAVAAGADGRGEPRPRRGSRRCSRCSTSRARSRATAAAGCAVPARRGTTTPSATRR